MRYVCLNPRCNVLQKHTAYGRQRATSSVLTVGMTYKLNQST